MNECPLKRFGCIVNHGDNHWQTHHEEYCFPVYKQSAFLSNCNCKFHSLNGRILERLMPRETTLRDVAIFIKEQGVI